MNGKSPVLLLIIGLVGAGLGWGWATYNSSSIGISPRTATDYVHAVIEADRTFYTQHVVERMEAMLIVTASEKWRKDQKLPLPAQFLKEASRGLHIRGKPFRYRLVSPWPIEPSHGPKNKEEEQAFNQVVEYGEVVEDYVTINNEQFYKAIYPDRAVSKACVSCHNSHENSPKRDFKLNDVMGGLEILIPLPE